MGIAEIISSILNYDFHINFGGSDFVFGISVAGIVAVLCVLYGYNRWLKPKIFKTK